MNKAMARMTAERRVAHRAPVSIDAWLRKRGQTGFKVLIRDLSRTGCRGETLSRMNAGERVWVALPDFAPIEGAVKWVNQRGFGIHWDSPMHNSVFEHIRKRYPELVR